MIKNFESFFNNCDGVLIVSKDYRIKFNSRYQTGKRSDIENYLEEDYLGRNFLEVFPDIDPKTSTLVEVLKTGRPVYRKNQEFLDYRGRYFKTNNVSLPIFQNGKIVGAIELVQDVTTVEDLLEKDRVDKISLSEGERIGDKSSSKLFTFEDILSQDKHMEKAILMAKEFSHIDNPVLIYGETGTGKEMFAQAIISQRGTSLDRVVMQNCAAIPETLIEATLFGTEKGAYTGAERTRGLFQQANNGVIFLDELNALPYQVQGKLLRVLQEGTFRPIGSNSEVLVKTKIIATINTDPLKAIEEKTLRDDLFYRLSSCLIHLLPLRERRDDIFYYIDVFIIGFSKLYDKNIREMTPELTKKLAEMDWKGNVRELKHVIEAMVSRSESEVLGIENLPAYLLTGHQPSDNNSPGYYSAYKYSLDLNESLAETEKRLIFKALRLAKGNKTQAANLLKIPRQTLNYKLKKYSELNQT